MSESLETDDKQAGASPQITNVSGGVNVDAQRDVTIGGDVVGRDKISSTQNIDTDGGAYIAGNVEVGEGGEFIGRDKIIKFILSPWGLIGLAVIFAVTALIITGVIKLPTPLAFAPATEGQSLIIVADFEDRSGGKYQGIDPAQYIYEQLTAQAKKDNLDVRIERLRHIVDDTTVRPTGETYGATLVLWGWYDALTITPRLERIKTQVDYQSTEEGKHLGLADPTKVESNVVTDLPSQATYLVLLAFGLDAYDSHTNEKALSYFGSALAAIPNDRVASTNPAETYFFRGNVYYNTDDIDRAFADYNEAIELNEDFAEAYNNRGNVYDKKGDTGSAINDYTKAIQLNTTTTFRITTTL